MRSEFRSFRSMSKTLEILVRLVLELISRAETPVFVTFERQVEKRTGPTRRNPDPTGQSASFGETLFWRRARATFSKRRQAHAFREMT